MSKYTIRRIVRLWPEQIRAIHRALLPDESYASFLESGLVLLCQARQKDSNEPVPYPSEDNRRAMKKKQWPEQDVHNPQFRFTQAQFDVIELSRREDENLSAFIRQALRVACMSRNQVMPVEKASWGGDRSEDDS